MVVVVFPIVIPIDNSALLLLEGLQIIKLNTIACRLVFDNNPFASHLHWFKKWFSSMKYIISTILKRSPAPRHSGGQGGGGAGTVQSLQVELQGPRKDRIPINQVRGNQL